MGTRTYEHLSIEKFGEHLLGTGDLDPIYLAVRRMDMAALRKHRFMLAYWCFYNAGLACFLSDKSGTEFWDAFELAARNAPGTPAPIGTKNPVNGGWPRGAERRHFRGQQAIKATLELREKYPTPEFAMNHLVRESDVVDPIPYKTICSRVQEWRGFGDWISFKVGDMIDRCGVANVKFDFDEAMYDTPRKGALIKWKMMHGAPQESTIDDETAAVREVVDYLVKHFTDLGYKAPPLEDRAVGLQEIETILCKWKSHLGGSYPLFNDIVEIRHGLAPWADHSETAKAFLAAMPEVTK